MSDESALLCAIRAHPAEDTPRLVYADWLQENGREERAEFIRLQCQLAAWDCTFKQCPEQPGWKHNCGTDENGYWLCQPLRSRERDILDLRNPLADNEHIADPWFTNDAFGMTTHGSAGPFWLSPTKPPYASSFKVEIARGFVGAVRCDNGDGWAAHGDALLRFQPVTRVEFLYPPDLNADAGGYYLAHDPELRAFTRRQIDAARLHDDPSRDSVTGIVLPLMRLRWPGVTFTRASGLNAGVTVEADGSVTQAIDGATVPAEPVVIPAPDLPRVSEIGFGAPMGRDAVGLSRTRRFQVENAAHESAAVDACGLSLLDPHPTDPRFRVAGFEVRHALGINNAWNVTVTYRPAQGSA